MASMAPQTSWSLTEHLLSEHSSAYKTATQSPFLLAAAEGRLHKDVLSRWLANDRLYIHAYIGGAGRLLSALKLPPTVPSSGKDEAPETRVVDWLIEALAAVRKEERFFFETARRYELSVDPATQTPPLPGLAMMQSLFGSISAEVDAASWSTPKPLTWLEGAVIFWGTERCYLDAWSWAKSKQPVGSDAAGAEDADGGALRKEFIPNWSSAEFAQFVSRLGHIIDAAVGKEVEEAGQDVKKDLLERVEAKWRELLAAEASFWPDVETRSQVTPLEY